MLREKADWLENRQHLRPGLHAANRRRTGSKGMRRVKRGRGMRVEEEKEEG